MSNARHIQLGRKGEGLAKDFLEKEGFKILEENYRTPFGQVDIIAKEKDTVCFIEVKTRKSDNPEELGFSLDRRKIRHISRVALYYLKSKKLLNSPARFDVVWIVNPFYEPKLDIIRNAFELDKRYSY